MIDIVRLYEDYGITYRTSGHKHVQTGWIGVPCPFCSGNPGYHLGYCIDTTSKYAGSFVCWRCGGKKTNVTLSRILRVSEDELYRLGILQKYKTKGGRQYRATNIRKGPGKTVSCRFPAGTTKLSKRHKNYLTERGYDWEKIERIWKIKGTGPAGPFKHRIIIPIHFDGHMVSFQGRDITDRSEMKYKACPQELEARPHKHCLYGEEYLIKYNLDTAVVDEGVTDTWTLGPGAVGTFGVKYKQAQVRLLSKYKRIFILYDSKQEDPQAGEQAELLAKALTSGNRHVEIIDLFEGDPGSMNHRDARDLMIDLLGRNIYNRLQDAGYN